MSLAPADAAFLLTCLRFLGAEAPCQPRIDAVIRTVAGSDEWQDCRVPPTVFARALSIAAVLWAIDTGLVRTGDRDLAQRVLEHLWAMGPIRPELIGAQLRCLVGQDPGDRHCRWTCPAMRRANAGYARADGSIGRTLLPDLLWTVREAATDVALPSAPATGIARWLPRQGARIRCRECGRPGTVLGVDGDDGWTVIEHHPPVVQRSDGMWEARSREPGTPPQCRFMAHGVATAAG